MICIFLTISLCLSNFWIFTFNQSRKISATAAVWPQLFLYKNRKRTHFLNHLQIKIHISLWWPQYKIWTQPQTTNPIHNPLYYPLLQILGTFGPFRLFWLKNFIKLVHHDGRHFMKLLASLVISKAFTDQNLSITLERKIFKVKIIGLWGGLRTSNLSLEHVKSWVRGASSD